MSQLAERGSDPILWDSWTAIAPNGSLLFRPDAPLRHDALFATLYLAQIGSGPAFFDHDIDFRLFSDRIEVSVRDSGPGFELGDINGDATSPEHLFDARGRGIFIMRSCMDTVDFEFSESGTICHLMKRLPPAPAGAG